MNDEETRQLMREIRDGQREHLAEYRRVTARSIELEEQAVGRQQHLAALCRRVLLVGTLLIVPLLGLLAYLLVRWSHRPF